MALVMALAVGAAEQPAGRQLDALSSGDLEPAGGRVNFRENNNKIDQVRAPRAANQANLPNNANQAERAGSVSDDEKDDLYEEAPGKWLAGSPPLSLSAGWPTLALVLGLVAR